MFARAPHPPIFAPEALSWEFPSRADRDQGTVPEPGRLGGAPSGGRRARLAPAARQAASAAKGAVHGAAAIACELLLLADPELEARAEEFARAGDGSGSRAGEAADRRLERPHHARAVSPRPRDRRPGAPVAAAHAHPCVMPR